MTEELNDLANAESVEEIVDSAKVVLPGLASYMIEIFIAILVFLIGSRVIRWAVGRFKKHLSRLNIDAGFISFSCSVLRVSLYAVLIIAIGLRLGVKQTSVAALLGTAGVTLGLALQGGLSNVASGVLILIFKPFQVGDFITSADGSFSGEVYKIELFYTTLKVGEIKRIVIPNSSITGNTILNETMNGIRQIQINVDISYEASISKAKEILEKIIAEDPLAGKESYDIYVDSLGESAVHLGVIVRIPQESAVDTKWRLNQKIKETFDEEGIRIPYHQLDVHVHTKE